MLVLVSVGCRECQGDCPRTHISRFRATVCGVKVGFPCCRCVREPPAPLKSIEPRISRIGRCILNHVLIIRCIFSVIKRKMYANIVYLLYIYCDSIVVAFFFFSYRFSARFFAKKSFSYQGDVFSWRGIWLIRMLLNCVLITRLSELWFMGFRDFWDKRLAFCLNRGLSRMTRMMRILGVMVWTVIDGI